MKALIIFLCFGFFNLVVAKESRAVLEAIREYRNDQPKHFKSAIPPEKALSDLITKINTLPAPNILAEEVLSVLSNTRDSPSVHLIPKLKEIWSHYRKSTFRAKYADEWRTVKSLDFSQVVCDEIKVLIKKMGGNIDDIEPLNERTTHDLNEIRVLLRGVKDVPQDQPLLVPEFKDLAKRLHVIIESCRFDASGEDDKLHLFYVLEIIQLLGDQAVWSGLETSNAADPVIIVFDEVLSKALPRIDVNWVQTPTGSMDKNQDGPSVEQMIQWRKNSLEGYQQMNLRKLRDQILSNVAQQIVRRKNDDTFKQEMLKRFAKNDACRKAIEDRVHSSEKQGK